jgi:hypothetical protein
MRIRGSWIAVAAAAVVMLASAAGADSGGWESPDSLAGLVGSYTRPPFGGGPITFVTLAGSDGYRAEGPYTRFVDVGRGQLAIQTGTYLAIGNNPAIGAIITFLDDAGSARDSFFIAGIKHDPLGRRITAIELIDGNGKLFSLVRVGL